MARPGVFANLLEASPATARWRAYEKERQDIPREIQKRLDAWLTTADRSSLRDTITSACNQAVLPAALTQRSIELSLRSEDLPLLREVVRRDVVTNWLDPTWRLRMSYRELIESRFWTKGLLDPVTEPIAEQTCQWELAVQAQGQAVIAEHFQGWLNQQFKRFAREVRSLGRKISKADAQLLASAGLVRLLTRTIADPFGEAYGKRIESVRRRVEG
jgi:hypothetical protein